MNKKIYAALAFIIPLVLYILTLAPDVMFTDSGELAGVCANLGIAHSTGYPLFTIIGHLWSLLPLGMSKIYQINLFSAIATAFGSFLFFFISEEVIKIYINQINSKIKAKKDKKNKPLLEISDFYISMIALFSSLSLAFGRTIWGQATSIEVYSMQIVFFNLIFLFLLKTKDYSSLNKSILFLAFAIGLGFSNHMNTILVMPLVFWIYFFGFNLNPDFSINKFKILALLFIPVIIGLSFYIYLPLRAMSYPDFNWGWVHRSWDKFIYHVSGKQYQVWMFSDPQSVSKNFGIFINNLPFEFAIIGLIPILYGIINLIRTPGILIALLISIISCMIYSLNYSIHDIDNYFILAIIALSIFMVIGLLELFFIIKNQKHLIFLFALIPIFSIYLNYSDSDQSKNYMVSDYTKTMIDNLDKDALIISRQWDYFCSAFWFKQKIEGQRKDVTLIEKELLRRTWYIEQLRKKHPELVATSGNEMANFLKDLEGFESETPGFERTIQQNFESMLMSFIDNNIDKRPVYVTLDLLQDAQDFGFLKKYTQIPQGYAIKLEKSTDLKKIDLSKIDISRFVKSFKYDNNHLEEGIKEVASNNLTNLGNYSLMKAKDTLSAIKAYEMALKINPENNLALQFYSKIKR